MLAWYLLWLDLVSEVSWVDLANIKVADTSAQQEVYTGQTDQLSLSADSAVRHLINNENFIQRMRHTFFPLSSILSLSLLFLEQPGPGQWEAGHGPGSRSDNYSLGDDLSQDPADQLDPDINLTPRVLLSHRCGPVSNVLRLAQSSCMSGMGSWLFPAWFTLPASCGPRAQY